MATFMCHDTKTADHCYALSLDMAQARDVRRNFEATCEATTPASISAFARGSLSSPANGEGNREGRPNARHATCPPSPRCPPRDRPRRPAGRPWTPQTPPDINPLKVSLTQGNVCFVFPQQTPDTSSSTALHLYKNVMVRLSGMGQKLKEALKVSARANRAAVRAARMKTDG